MPHSPVLIIGAGISGVGIALHLTKINVDYTILEGRSSYGGTWDLFKYPGIRSDSDMMTFTFADKPWPGNHSLAPANEIKGYLKETIDEYDIAKHIKYDQKVLSANFNSKTKKWTVHVSTNGQAVAWTCDFFVSCCGYYNYDKGFRPDFPQEEKFKGQLIHPQFWPEKLDYKNKNVVVIGSGATAVTLIPALAKDGVKKVTMLQRTPSYLVSLPGENWVYKYILRKILPGKLAYLIIRWFNILQQWVAYWGFRYFPNLARKYLMSEIARHLKGSKVDPKIHFNPPYSPWDQRLCVVPDADLFKALKTDKADIVTDKIERFDETGIVLASGKHLDADIVVTATGLDLKFLGGVEMSVDGKNLDASKMSLYKGVLVSGVPNFMPVIGYINSSWTLKVDLCGIYFSKLLEYMREKGYKEFVVDGTGVTITDEPIMGQLHAGYIQRAAHLMPKQGDKEEFIVQNAYLRDRKILLHPNFHDDYLKFM